MDHSEARLVAKRMINTTMMEELIMKFVRGEITERWLVAELAMLQVRAENELFPDMRPKKKRVKEYL